MSANMNLIDDITRILDVARLAPSVHNTQPWIVSVNEESVHIELDQRHVLGDGDPTGRQTMISLGIFCEAIVIGANSCGYQLKHMQQEHKSATISFRAGKESATTKAAVDGLKKRATDRSIYQPCDVSPNMAKSIESSYRKAGVQVWVRSDQPSILKTAQLTGQGIGMALSSPNFRKELSQYLTEPWSSKKRGISTRSLYIPQALAAIEPVLMRLGLGLGSEVKLEKKRWLSSSANVYIATKGDMPEYWFEAGRAYLHVSLQIEKLGLSQATSAATVEASDFHEDIEAMLGTNFRLQSVLRVGVGSKHRAYSPRVSTETLLATSN